MRNFVPQTPNAAFTRMRVTTLFALAGYLFIVGLVYADVITTFDSGTEGWRIALDNNAAWRSSGGNPGGCLAVNDLAYGDTCYAIAPAVYLGDWSLVTSADTLSVDIFLNTIDGYTHINPRYIFRISGPGGIATALSGEFPSEDQWKRFSVSLDPTEWQILEGTWESITANVTAFWIWAEFIEGREDVRLDNIALLHSPPPVFLPCVHETFNTAGLGSWSFSGTGGVANPGSGGNTGGHCRISDGTGTAFAFVPPFFHGDWSTYADSGFITIDLRILSYTGNLMDSPQFITISGNGGTASVDLPKETLPPPGQSWKTYRFPLTETVWNVTSGNWADLLADVTNCKICLEFSDGAELVGIDNFGRQYPECAEIDMPVVVHGCGVVYSGYSSLVLVSNAAFNPFDGMIYGLIDAAPTSGGGLYATSGVCAGQRLQAFDLPAHLIFNDNGYAFVTEDTPGSVWRWSVASGKVLWVSGFHSGDDDPFGLCFAPEGFEGPNVAPGDLLVTDWGNNGADEVWAFSTSVAEGERRVLADPGDVNLFDIAGGDSSVWICDALNGNAIYSLLPSGSLVHIPLDVSLYSIRSIVYDSITKMLYLADGNRAFYRVDPKTGAVTLIADGFLSMGICGLEIDLTSHRLWVTDTVANRIYEFNLDHEAPEPPQAVHVHFSVEGNTLTWQESESEDTDRYIVYRSDTGEFEPSSENLLAFVTGNEYVDDLDGFVGSFWDACYRVAAVDCAGNVGTPTNWSETLVTGIGDSDAPEHYVIWQNVPNPFNPRTTVWLDIPRAGPVQLAVHDLRGRLVRTLLSGQMSEGRHPVVWDGLDDRGAQAASGVYLVRLVTSDGEQRAVKVTLSK